MVSFAQARAMDPNFNARESTYAWRITRDHLAGAFADIYGPWNSTDEQIEVLRHPVKNADQLTRFRIYDDDDELYFSGYFFGDSESEDGFGPLDDYGLPDAGATRIDYLRENGEWETL
ncbi:MAG: hypothetical protein ACREHG_07405 [Candidatus Saccharimonadales bacterium]